MDSGRWSDKPFLHAPHVGLLTDKAEVSDILGVGGIMQIVDFQMLVRAALMPAWG